MARLFIVFIIIFKICNLTAQIFYSADTVSVVSGTTIYLPDTFYNAAAGKLYNNGTIEAKKHWINNGFTNAGSTGSVLLTGTTQQKILGNSNTNFYNVTFNNTLNNPKAFYIDLADFNVYGTATLTDGIIDANGTFMPVFQAGSAVTGASHASHFMRSVRKLGTSNFEFPIGDSSYFRPASISTVGAGGDFTASYYRINPYTITSTLGSGINHISYKEYWKVTGGSTAKLTLSWDTTLTSGPVTSLTDLIVVGASAGGVWNNFKNFATTGSYPSGTIINDSAISNWQYFTLGSTTVLNPLPIDNLSWDAKKHATSRVKCEWVVKNENLVSHYIVEKSNDGNNWNVLNKTIAKGQIGTQNLQYHCFDNNPQKGVNYYRLYQFFSDGSMQYYGTKKVFFDGTTIAQLQIFPNPSAHQLNVAITGIPENSPVKVQIIDASGKLVLEQKSTSYQQIDISSFSDGVYTCKVYWKNFATTQQFIKVKK